MVLVGEPEVGQRHIGIGYRAVETNEVRFLHLAWHCHLKNDAVSPDYFTYCVGPRSMPCHGEWLLCDDGIVRPIMWGRILDGDGKLNIFAVMRTDKSITVALLPSAPQKPHLSRRGCEEIECTPQKLSFSRRNHGLGRVKGQKWPNLGMPFDFCTASERKATIRPPDCYPGLNHARIKAARDAEAIADYI